MQKAFIAIALALTLTCASAAYSAQAWVKAPVSILADTDTNFTTVQDLDLGGMSTSDVNVIAVNVTQPADPTKANMSSLSWMIWTKAITTKDLTSSSNSSYSLSSPLAAGVAYGYVVGVGMGNETGIPQLYLYQYKLSSATALPRVAITSNMNASFTPMPVAGAGAAWKTSVFFYLASAAGKVNFTSITIGGSSMGKEYTFSTTWNTTLGSKDGMDCDWGEALSSSQVFCAYTEAGVYKVAVVDFSSGTYTNQGTVGTPYMSTFKCSPYVTDKKYYGLLCSNLTAAVNATIPTMMQTLYVSSNTTNTLVQLGNSSTVVNSSVQSYRDMKQYGPYLAIFYTNPSASNMEISYDIWDVYANSQWQAKKTILNYDAVNSTFAQYTIPQGGMYGLLYNFNTSTKVKSSIFVGQIMGASYLTTVFGALMTIVAGLFLF